MAEKSLLDILLFKLSSHESVTPQEDLRVSPGRSLLCVIWRIILGQQHYHQHFPVRQTNEGLTGNWRHVEKRAIPQDLDHLPSGLEGF